MERRTRTVSAPTPFSTSPRQPRFFIGPPSLSFRNQKERVKLPKFEVRLDSERLRHSFHIEKDEKEMGDDWYWPRFLEVLADGAVQDELSDSAANHDLCWLVHLEEGAGASGDPLPSKRIRFNTFGPDEPFTSYATFVDYLSTLPTHQWCNIYIAGEIAKDQAIALGVKISDPITQTFKSLTPFFQRLLT